MTLRNEERVRERETETTVVVVIVVVVVVVVVVDSFFVRSIRTLVKPQVYRNIVLFDQILMGACLTVNMSGGETYIEGKR